MRKLSFMLSIIALLALVGAVHAQDGGALPPLDPTQLGEQAITFLLGLLGAFMTSPATTAVVGILKRYVFKTTPADTLALVTSAVLMLLLVLAITLGYEGEFRSIVQVVTALLTALAGVTVNLHTAARTYNANRRVGAAVVGYQRPSQFVG